MVGITEVISESRFLANQEEYMIVYYDREKDKVFYNIYPLSQSYKQYNYIAQTVNLKTIYLLTLFSPYLKTESELQNFINNAIKNFLVVKNS